MVAFVLNDIYFTIIHLLTSPIACTFGDAFVIFATGIWSSQISIAYYAATFSQTMPLLMHLFIYRFIAVKMPQKTEFYTRWNSAMVVLLTLLVESNIWHWGSYFLYAPDQEGIKYMKPFFDKGFGDVEYLVSLYWENDTFRVHKFAITLSFDAFLGIFLAVIVYCSIAIFKTLKNKIAHNPASKRTQLLQKQLFHTLIVQMLVPMLFVYTPCAGIISLPMLRTGESCLIPKKETSKKMSLNVFPNLVSCSLTIFPLLDAFIVIFGVKSYRDAVLGWRRPPQAWDSSHHHPTQRHSIVPSTSMTTTRTISNVELSVH